MKQIEKITDFENLLLSQRIWNKIAIQSLDLRPYTGQIMQTVFKDCIFLGCEMTPEVDYYLLHSENALFPKLNVPFNTYINSLYNKDTLYDGYNYKNPASYLDTNDYKIYRYFMDNGKGEPTSIQVTLAQRLHDHAVSDALSDFLNRYADPLRVVAMMGGHNLERGNPDFLKIAKISMQLCQEGFLMVSGGGPGAMEATHLGVWFAGRPVSDLESAVEILAAAPTYKHELWLSKAFEVIERFPRINNFESLGIPTWWYGHEPPTPFATHIAKYFANSVREEGLLAIAKGGVIYAPGNAGTIQEIFQDATQNHYLVFDIASPMVFMNKKYWTEDRPVYPFLQKMTEEGKYKNLLLSISDENEEIIHTIKAFYHSNKR
jgi:predicted Rossmann-fold nucleotide-binding protein